jgi:hypothetical protein
MGIQATQLSANQVQRTINNAVEKSDLKPAEKSSFKNEVADLTQKLKDAGKIGPIDNAIKASDSFKDLLSDFSKTAGQDKLGRAIWNAIPDALQTGGHGVIALACAYMAYRAGVNWADHVADKAAGRVD